MIFRLLRGVLRTIRMSSRLLVLILFIGLIGLNVATLISSRVFDALSSVVSALTDRPIVAKRHAATRADLERERREKARLEHRASTQARTIRGQGATIRGQGHTIRAQDRTIRATAASLQVARADLSAAQAGNLDRDRRLNNQRERVRSTTMGVRSRIVSKASSIPATLVGEFYPVVGMAVVAAEAGVELFVACKTLEELDSLLHYMDAAPNDDETARVCGMTIPDISTVWMQVHTQSSDLFDEATDALKEAAPDFSEFSFPDLPTFSFPDLPEFSLPNFSEGTVAEWYDWMATSQD